MRLKWRYRKRLRKKYGRLIWKVTSRKGQKGFFKSTVHRYPRRNYRILVANEYIAAYLAKSLGLPVARVTQAHVRGPRGRIKHGLISMRARGGKVIPWKKAKKKLLKKPHKWYGIDHGISLFGHPIKWNLRRARKTFSCQKACKFCLHAGDKKKQRIPRGLKRVTRDNRKQLEKMVKKIQAMPKGKLRKAIRSVPKGLLTRAEKTFIRKVLLCRRKHLKKAWKRVSKLFA